MGKIYNRRDLVLAYIEAHKQHYPSEDFERYAKTRLAALEQAFGVALTHQGVRNRAISAMIMLFDHAAQAYRMLDRPSQGFLDASLIHHQIERSGTNADHVFAQLQQVGALADQSAAIYLSIMEDLLTMLWGPLDQTFTSARLRELGFDDTSEPVIDWDEW